LFAYHRPLGRAFWGLWDEGVPPGGGKGHFMARARKGDVSHTEGVMVHLLAVSNAKLALSMNKALRCSDIK